MKIRFGSNRTVRCHAQMVLPLAAGTAWGQLRDFARFASHDFFHARIAVEGVTPRRGARLSIDHRYLLFRTSRVGRILRWREGEGFAFSDLSRSGVRSGFPHVLEYRLEPVSGRRCRLHLQVSGRWTAPVPRWMTTLWLRWVFGHVSRSVENRLLYFAAVERRRLERSESSGLQVDA